MPDAWEPKVAAAVADGRLSEGSAAGLRAWLAGERYRAVRAGIESLIWAGEWETLDYGFHTVLEFGTGGRRGRMVPGTNGINEVTIAESAQGAADLIRRSGRVGPVAIVCDTRHNSAAYARLCAEVFAANGIQVRVFAGPRSTPELSFAVRHLGCAGGCVISASHNPPADNGFKYYAADGAQIRPPDDVELIGLVTRLETVRRMPWEAGVAAGLIRDVTGEIDPAYIAAVVAEGVRPDERDCRIVFSPLHGTGSTSVLPVLAAAGFRDLMPVESQMPFDGRFPTVAGNKPNPEEPAALEAAIALAGQARADLVLVSDPDADRLGVAAVEPGGGYRTFSGNEVAAVLCSFVLESIQAAGGCKPDDLVLATHVTTGLIADLAAAYGVSCDTSLPVGFKYLGGAAEARPGGRFLFGCEESLGYLKGDYARDKDAALAALLMAELAATLRRRGETVGGYLETLYRRHGRYRSTQRSVAFPGVGGIERMRRLMDRLRAAPIGTLGSRPVALIEDRAGRREIEPATGIVRDSPALPCEVLVFHLSKDRRTWVAVRPSGTEPKMKVYFQFHSHRPEIPADGEESGEIDRTIEQLLTLGGPG